MRIIARKPIEAFKLKHPDAESALDSWHKTMSEAEFNTSLEMKAVFQSVDIVGKGFVFDISGNKYRLAASVHFNTRRVYIREIMTHAEYSKNTWRQRHQDFS